MLLRIYLSASQVAQMIFFQIIALKAAVEADKGLHRIAQHHGPTLRNESMSGDSQFSRYQVGFAAIRTFSLVFIFCHNIHLSGLINI